MNWCMHGLGEDYGRRVSVLGVILFHREATPARPSTSRASRPLGPELPGGALGPRGARRPRMRVLGLAHAVAVVVGKDQAALGRPTITIGGWHRGRPKRH